MSGPPSEQAEARGWARGAPVKAGMQKNQELNQEWIITGVNIKLAS